MDGATAFADPPAMRERAEAGQIDGPRRMHAGDYQRLEHADQLIRTFLVHLGQLGERLGELAIVHAYALSRKQKTMPRRVLPPSPRMPHCILVASA